MLFIVALAPVLSAEAPGTPSVDPSPCDVDVGQTISFTFSCLFQDHDTVIFVIKFRHYEDNQFKVFTHRSPEVPTPWYSGSLLDFFFYDYSFTWNQIPYGAEQETFQCEVVAYEPAPHGGSDPDELGDASPTRYFSVTVYADPPPDPPDDEDPPPEPPDPDPPEPFVQSMWSEPDYFFPGSPNTIYVKVKNRGEEGGSFLIELYNLVTDTDIGSTTDWLNADEYQTYSFTETCNFDLLDLSVRATAHAGTLTHSRTLVIPLDPIPPGPPPPISAAITIHPSYSSTIEIGEFTLLSWTTSNADTVSIDNGIGSVGASGYHQVYPTVTTTYTLSATGEAGTVTDSVVVTVIDPAAPVPPDDDDDDGGGSGDGTDDGDSGGGSTGDDIPGQFAPQLNLWYLAGIAAAIIVIAVVHHKLKKGRWPFQKKNIISHGPNAKTVNTSDYDITIGQLPTTKLVGLRGNTQRKS